MKATGLQDEAEVAIHAIKTIFGDDETEAGILVEASNGFNLLNRMVALQK